jgi:hypothetical protein
MSSITDLRDSNFSVVDWRCLLLLFAPSEMSGVDVSVDHLISLHVIQ